VKLPKTSIQEHGDHVYITSPVQLYEPDAAAIEQFAFATDLRSAAPNPKLLWLRGQYVEADNANSNGDQWTAGDLGIKALTPVLMPITVMHDLRSAVGTIADAKLLTPEKDNVPRARIDTVLAVWEHRFPEVAAEARINASQGTLMQSMECVPLDTEILTRRGWKRWDEVRPGDETVGYDPATQRNTWTTITGIVRKRANVVALGHGKWRVRCTAGHRWLTAFGTRIGSKYVFEGAGFTETSDLSHRHQLILSAKASIGGELPTTPEEAAVIGWIAGDGSYRDKHGAVSCSIAQSKPDGVMALELALARAGVDYNLTVRPPNDGRVGLKQNYAKGTYYIPAATARSIWERAELDHLTWDSFVLKLSPDARASFLEAIYQAEGNENHGARCIGQNPGPLKNAIALAGYLEGYRPTSNEYGGDRSQATSHIRLAFRNINGGNLSLTSMGEEEVWCPVTDLSSWTMRQEGKILLTGNCISSAYSCSECGAMFHRLPAGAEKRDWCAHLRGETLVAGGTKASRILGNVTFTGVGLIFGTRGARGAFKDAYLDVEELAAFHNEVHAGTVKRTRRKNTMDIEDAKYEALVAGKTAAESKVTELTAAVAAKDKDIEKLEADKLAAEEKATQAETAKTAAEEAVRVAAMRDERLAALGAGFKAKLDKLATTSALVKKQAGEMSDADWTARLVELSETLAIKHDAAAETPTADPAAAAAAAAAAADPLAGMVFTREQVATSVTGAVQEVTAGADTPAAPSSASRQSVVGGLIKRPARRPAKA
jgi:hypothetical protein